jgi:tetratricopeptide (TPR) repeat protein
MKARVAALLLLALALTPGCNAPTKSATAKEQARARWEQMRAKVKLQLAERNFESGQVDEAGKLCEEILALDPTSLDGHLLGARVNLEKGQVSQAEAALDTASGLGRSAPELYYLRGLLAEHRENVGDAVSWYKQAYEASPDQVEYLLAYAESLVADNQIEAVAELLVDRRRDFEQNARVQVLAAQSLGMVGRHRESGDCYVSAVRLAPNDPGVREEAGLALLTAGRVREAQTVLMPLWQSPKTKPSAAVTRTFAVALLDANQPQAVVSLLEKAIGADDADSYPLLLLLSKACLMTDRPTAGVDAARRAARIKPRSIEARLMVACCALAAGDRDTAVGAAQEVIAVRPDDPEALTLLERAVKLQVADAGRK